MPHITKVVEWRELNNGQVAVRIRCCDDPATDHWHTMASSVAADSDKLTSSIAAEHTKLATRHEVHEKAKRNLKKLVEANGNSDSPSHGQGGKGTGPR